MTELESYKSQTFDLFAEKVYSNVKEVDLYRCCKGNT